MRFIEFPRSAMGRTLRVVVGFALIVYGGTSATLFGLVLMMAGIVPAVTGLADIVEAVVAYREAKSASQGRPRERRV